MGHYLEFDLDDETYQAIKERARREGTDAESLVMQLLRWAADHPDEAAEMMAAGPHCGAADPARPGVTCVRPLGHAGAHVGKCEEWKR